LKVPDASWLPALPERLPRRPHASRRPGSCLTTAWITEDGCGQGPGLPELPPDSLDFFPRHSCPSLVKRFFGYLSIFQKPYGLRTVVSEQTSN
jgi:hypothetical protein